MREKKRQRNHSGEEVREKETGNGGNKKKKRETLRVEQQERNKKRGKRREKHEKRDKKRGIVKNFLQRKKEVGKDREYADGLGFDTMHNSPTTKSK